MGEMHWSAAAQSASGAALQSPHECALAQVSTHHNMTLIVASMSNLSKQSHSPKETPICPAWR